MFVFGLRDQKNGVSIYLEPRNKELVYGVRGWGGGGGGVEMNISISILDAISLIGQLIMIGEVKLEIKCVIITI